MTRRTEPPLTLVKTPEQRMANLCSKEIKGILVETALEVATEAALLAIERGLPHSVVLADLTREILRHERRPHLGLVSKEI